MLKQDNYKKGSQKNQNNCCMENLDFNNVKEENATK